MGEPADGFFFGGGGCSDKRVALQMEERRGAGGRTGWGIKWGLWHFGLAIVFGLSLGRRLRRYRYGMVWVGALVVLGSSVAEICFLLYSCWTLDFSRLSLSMAN